MDEASQKLQDYVERVVALAGTDVTLQQRCHGWVREKIMAMRIAGTLAGTDWGQTPLPALEEIQVAPLQSPESPGLALDWPHEPTPAAPPAQLHAESRAEPLAEQPARTLVHPQQEPPPVEGADSEPPDFEDEESEPEPTQDAKPDAKLPKGHELAPNAKPESNLADGPMETPPPSSEPQDLCLSKSAPANSPDGLKPAPGAGAIREAPPTDWLGPPAAWPPPPAAVGPGPPPPTAQLGPYPPLCGGWGQPAPWSAGQAGCYPWPPPHSHPGRPVYGGTPAAGAYPPGGSLAAYPPAGAPGAPPATPQGPPSGPYPAPGYPHPPRPRSGGAAHDRRRTEADARSKDRERRRSRDRRRGRRERHRRGHSRPRSRSRSPQGRSCCALSPSGKQSRAPSQILQAQPPPIPKGYGVKVSNVPPELTAQDLAEAFQEVSQQRIEAVDVFRDKAGQPTGEALVVFNLYSDAQNAVLRYHGGGLNGNRLTVVLSTA